MLQKPATIYIYVNKKLLFLKNKIGLTLVVNLEYQGLDLLSYLELHEQQAKYKKSDFKDIGQHVT